MNTIYKITDTVALLKDIPASNLLVGQVGVVVEILAPKVYEVEFCNSRGETIVQLPVKGDELMLLRYEAKAA